MMRRNQSHYNIEINVFSTSGKHTQYTESNEAVTFDCSDITKTHNNCPSSITAVEKKADDTSIMAIAI